MRDRENALERRDADPTWKNQLLYIGDTRARSVWQRYRRMNERTVAWLDGRSAGQMVGQSAQDTRSNSSSANEYYY